MTTGKLLSSNELMDKIIYALNSKSPCSIISVGATEAFAAAQYTIFPEEVFMNDREALIANMGLKSGFEHRGIRFPNVQIRDDLVEAIRKADIVGYNTIVDYPRVLTERVFQAYNINPEFIFEANIRRVFMFSQEAKFKEMIRGRKILLIGALAYQAKEAMERNLRGELGFEIVGAVSIFEYEDIPMIKMLVDCFQFDLCLLAAGTNAAILAPYISERYGVVAFDIGSGMKSLITGELVKDAWITDIIGIDNLFNM